MARMTRILFAAALLAVPAVAAAEDRYLDPLSMDRFTPESTFAAEFAYEVWDEPPGVNSLTVFGLNIGGHYVAPGGVGGYVNIPLSYVALETALGLVDDSELALGNIEAGAMYAKQVTRDVAIVVHGGLALPTADDDGVGALQAYASVPRYGDLVQRIPNTTWLRLGVSPMGRAGKLFWRADLGADLAIDDDNNAGDISPVMHLGLGAGLDLGTAQLLGELVTDIVDNDAGDDSASTLAIGARFASGNLRPGVGLLFPLGFEGNDDYLQFALVVSLAGRLGH